MIKQISSAQNPAVKRLLQLQEKSRSRKKEGVFVVEGIREINLAIKGGFEIEEIYFCAELFDEVQILAMLKNTSYQPEITELSAEVYNKIAYRGSTEGLIAVVKSKNTSLENLQLESKNPLILVAEAPEKPGNIGALFRTADAANVDAVLVANPKTDLFNPNIIRSSVGCVFSNKIATGTTSEIIKFLKNKNIAIYAAALQASKIYSAMDFTTPCAIVVGTEAIGLSQEWIENSNQNIIIPMQGEIDSMNVSVAAGILIFEAKRQRGF
ncbi:TrmH family RNA methyltransferase [Gillisia sp. Q332]|uniref:TrmH family RNA methyltransferase n=1 Tax=Gillisia xinjiangensis TaxID=3384765 RepID=UPI00391A353B